MENIRRNRNSQDEKIMKPIDKFTAESLQKRYDSNTTLQNSSIRLLAMKVKEKWESHKKCLKLIPATPYRINDLSLE